MMRQSLIAVAISFVVLAGLGFAKARSSFNLSIQSPITANIGSEDVPAYHALPPNGPLPATLDPKRFPDPMTQNAYALAAKVKRVLYQQPCYCHCDREAGHKSLLDCFVDAHASMCDICKMEAGYAYKRTRQGKTAAQIRKEIVDGKWRDVDLSSDNSPPASQ